MIFGDRIRLRAIEREDIPRFVTWFNDPDVRHYLGHILPMSAAQETSWYEGMITRENPSGAYKGTALWPDQKISLETAIEIFTINSAHVLGLENEIGSIEVGKSADIIVLNQNLFEIPASDIADTKVLTTYFEGRPIFERS